MQLRISGRSALRASRSSLRSALRASGSLLVTVSAVLVLTSCATGSQSAAPAPPPSTVTVTTGPPPATPTPLGPVAVTPIVGSVLASPMPVAATDGKTHLAYELVLTNTSSQDVTVTSVAAVSGGRTLLSLSGNGLAYWMRTVGTPAPTATIGPAQTALIWLPRHAAAPRG